MYWSDGTVRILDQRALPHEEKWIDARTWEQVAEAIETMAVRGAPLIGVAAAYGLALAEGSEVAKLGLAATRPTAINLFHALDRVAVAENCLAEAKLIHEEEREANERIGLHGAALVVGDATVITICNTGSLAAPGIGTALGVVRTLHKQERLREVILCETRPRQQGLRLSAWECLHDGVPFRCVADSAAAWFMRTHGAQLVVAGADRIAKNGDTANKIGTYALAIAARQNGIPFAIAAPTSTIDTSAEDGAGIPIEERDPAELLEIDGHRVAPVGATVWNPAFDVTPASLIDWIVTEKGAYAPPFGFGV